MKYRKKPVIVEVVQFTGKNISEISEFTQAHDRNDMDFDVDKQEFYIDTLEGKMTAQAGDYIIEGVKGEFYPVKTDIFLETYEKVT